MFVMNNYLKSVGVALPKKWPGQNLTDLTCEYGPVFAYSDLNMLSTNLSDGHLSQFATNLLVNKLVSNKDENVFNISLFAENRQKSTIYSSEFINEGLWFCHCKASLAYIKIHARSTLTPKDDASCRKHADSNEK